MPSIKALLLTLLLFFFALIIVSALVKKSKQAQDAEVYAKQNPNCSVIKIHSGKNSLLECYLYFESASDFPKKLQEGDTLYIPMAKFIGERYPEEFPLRIKHIFSIPSEETDSIWIHGSSMSVARGKTPPWRNLSTGCKFPGPCPAAPTQIAARGKDALNAVNAILPGRVIKIEQDEFYSITIYHGENIYSKTDGILTLSDYAELGKNVSPDSALGFLPKKDSKFSLEITRNGKREKWERF
jgi:hypothetical protein